MTHLIYDIESFPNVFTLTAKTLGNDDTHVFEISERRNDWSDLLNVLTTLGHHGVEMVGFNNIGYDYPVIHAMLTGQVTPDAAGAYTMTKAIIESTDRFQYHVWPSDRLIPQIDLYKIHHFDNPARATSLKALQFAMRSESVQDLPFEPGTALTADQIDVLIEYNIHDVLETERFLKHSVDMIDFRRELNVNGDKLNFSDKKIGSQMMVDALGRDVCYQNGQPRQTIRSSLALGELIFPTVQLSHPDTSRVRSWLGKQVITETKGVFKDLTATVGDFELVFGLGGIHGSVHRKVYHSDDNRMIVDIDVTSLYPSIAIVNQLAPAHIGPSFYQTLERMRTERLTHAKGTSSNKALKLAMNGAYGDSNSPWSPFFDSAYTMATTINGQLLLTMLFEHLTAIPSFEPIQINTDGITMRVSRQDYDRVQSVCRKWESLTGLQLEEVQYTSMWVRDVNNYLALDVNGTLKAKGAYEDDKEWHKDPSNPCVSKASQLVLQHGMSVEQALMVQADPYDWMIRAKGSRGATIYHGESSTGAKIVRFYASLEGEPMSIRRPPPSDKTLGDFKKKQGVSDADYSALNQTGVWDERIHTKNRSVYEYSTSAVCKGHLTSRCDRALDFDWSNLDRSYYTKLVADLTNLTTVD